MNPILLDLRQALLDRGPIAAMPEAVWRRASALNTWGTNAIEGNTLGFAEVERLLLEERVVAGAPVRDVLETVQHDRAFRGLPRRLDEPLGAELALALHREVFHHVKPHAGQWRIVRVGIAGTRHLPPRPHELPGRLRAWERGYHERGVGDGDAALEGARMHWEFEAIHPFLDGNGRVGRLLLNHHLLRHNWPPVHVLPPDRDAYLAALEAGHGAGKGPRRAREPGGPLEPLRALLEALLARSLLDLLDQVGTRQDALRPLAELAERGPYDAKYLALRASQGALPAIKQGKAWRSSERALRLYVHARGRKE